MMGAFPMEVAELSAESVDGFAAAVLTGLKENPRRVPCKYLYDAAGSALFERICELPEYYPTRTELALLSKHAAELAAFMGADVELVEYGAGAGRKVHLLLDALCRPRAYVPVDISREPLLEAAQSIAADYPELSVRPVAADYTGLFHLGALARDARRRVGFFPGSTIGNFKPAEARAFLRRLAGELRGGGLLVGVDLVKDPALLHAAYNDAAGVTAAFNRNLLLRANRELAADFDPDGFAHYAFYHPQGQRIEMHLVSLVDQQVRIGGEVVRFAAGESIHTEDSQKYTVSGFCALAEEAGFVPRVVRVDDARRFSVHWLESPG